jgi:hypothetical protein
LNRRALRPCWNRRYWVKPWIYRRDQLGHYDTLMRELREEDPEASSTTWGCLWNYTMKSWLGSHPASPNKIPGGGKSLIPDWSLKPPSHDSYRTGPSRDYHVKQFSNGCLPSESFHCLVTVWSLSDCIRENRDAVGTDSVVFYYEKDTNRIRIGLRTG